MVASKETITGIINNKGTITGIIINKEAITTIIMVKAIIMDSNPAITIITSSLLTIATCHQIMATAKVIQIIITNKRVITIMDSNLLIIMENNLVAEISKGPLSVTITTTTRYNQVTIITTIMDNLHIITEKDQAITTDLQITTMANSPQIITMASNHLTMVKNKEITMARTHRAATTNSKEVLSANQKVSILIPGIARNSSAVLIMAKAASPNMNSTVVQGQHGIPITTRATMSMLFSEIVEHHKPTDKANSRVTTITDRHRTTMGKAITRCHHPITTGKTITMVGLLRTTMARTITMVTLPTIIMVKKTMIIGLHRTTTGRETMSNQTVMAKIMAILMVMATMITIQNQAKIRM